MLDKSKCFELYKRINFTSEEKIFDYYICMRKFINEIESFKYDSEDRYINSEEFKQGFLAGVKIMSALLLDI